MGMLFRLFHKFSLPKGGGLSTMTLLVLITVVQNQIYSKENPPLLLQRILANPHHRKTPGFSPFQVHFHHHIKNHLVDREESDLRLLGRIGSQEILHFLKWWEKKYFLRPSDLEGLYAANWVLEQKFPGKYWRGLNKRSKNQLKLRWFREVSHWLLPEYKQFLHEGGYRTTAIYRP
jgi:hypothetical protein